MTERQELRIVKGRTQATVEAIETFIMIGVVYYLLHPDQRNRHLALLKGKKDKVSHWVSVQHTITAIRNLPETDTQM
jgi:hypothetical protein